MNSSVALVKEERAESHTGALTCPSLKVIHLTSPHDLLVKTRFMVWPNCKDSGKCGRVNEYLVSIKIFCHSKISLVFTLCDEKPLEDNGQKIDMMLSTLLKDHLAVVWRRQ